MPIERAAVRGSERVPIPNSNQIGYPDPRDVVTITVYLRRRSELPHGQRVSRANFAHHYGANPADVAKIEDFAREFNLTIVDVDLARRSVQLSGAIAQMNEAFATQLRLFQSPEGLYRGRTGSLYVPADLQPIITGVFGLDNRPQARSGIRRNIFIGPMQAGDTSYTPNQVAQLYNYPSDSGGAGQTVGIIELGGGYQNSDLTTYFGNLGLPVPNVTAVSVDGAMNQPVGDPNSADGEVLLDIEVVGSIVPQAQIAVYFAPNTDQGFLDAITTAVHDTMLKPSVISISWGGAESTWTSQALTSFDQAFQDAGALGVTVCVASGDDGSEDNVMDGQAHVDFPAASPNVLACGGTRLESSNGMITSEVVWNQGPGNGASGGGVSENFPLPSYQSNARVPVSVNTGFAGRGVPDISGDADPSTGYQILVDGTNGVFGGTSAVAPLWSALIALINAQTGTSLGFVNPALYTDVPGTQAVNDIVSGNNGAYQAGPGWDPCTGWGSPNGQQLLSVLTSAASGTGTGSGVGA